MATKQEIRESDDLFCLKQGMLFFLVCVPKDWDDEKIAAVANARSATGISSDWSVDADAEDQRVPCKDDPDRVHVILNC